MAYELRPDEPIHDAVRRIAGEEVDTALARLDDARDAGATDSDIVEGVHEARKACKRLRGMVRLVRPALGDTYGHANRVARDAARELSDIRDDHALLASFDGLVAARGDQIPDDGLVPVRATLAHRADRATAAVAEDRGAVHHAVRLLVELRDQVPGWPLEDEDLREAVADGIARTAGRARDRFDDVTTLAGPPGDELLHQWRKRVKYSWYHVSLLEPAAPTMLGAQADLLHDLSDALGNDHDLAVLSALLQAEPDAFGGRGAVESTLLLVDGTRRDLQRRAVGVGARLHAEDPVAFGRRLVALVEAWWSHGPERRAGEVLDLHGVADELGEHTNGQLRDLARSIDLPGRSDLDRAGLLGALRAAGVDQP